LTCHLFLKIAITCAIFQLVGYRGNQYVVAQSTTPDSRKCVENLCFFQSGSVIVFCCRKLFRCLLQNKKNTILKDLTADLKAKNTKLSIQVRKLDSEKKYIKQTYQEGVLEVK
jgi:hypothetical protein